MSRPDIFITGMPHSGTTWCASLFEAAGFDIGGDDLKGISERQGREWMPSFEILRSVALQLGGSVEPHAPHWWRVSEDLRTQAREQYGPKFAELDWPEIVKLPGPYTVMFLDYINPLHVVVMKRDPWSWAMSMEANAFVKREIPLTDRPAMYVDAVEEIVESARQFPHTVVEFEQSVRDASYAHRMLGDLLGMERHEFELLHDQVVRPDWVGVNARNSGL